MSEAGSRKGYSTIESTVLSQSTSTYLTVHRVDLQDTMHMKGACDEAL